MVRYRFMVGHFYGSRRLWLATFGVFWRQFPEGGVLLGPCFRGLLDIRGALRIFWRHYKFGRFAVDLGLKKNNCPKVKLQSEHILLKSAVLPEEDVCPSHR